MFGATYGLDIQCIEAESLGPHKDKIQGKACAAKMQDASIATHMVKQKMHVPA